MQLTCPHCAKVINMTLEELASGGGRVVCPQCLGDFVAQVDLTGVTPSHKQASRQQPVAPADEGAAHFCHSCGKPLPGSRLNFCPYCGSSLQIAEPAPAAPARVETTATYSVAAQEPAVPVAEAGTAPQPAIGEMPYVKGYRYMPELHTREVRQQPASLLTHVVCGLIIVALLALFVWIVYMGNRS